MKNKDIIDAWAKIRSIDHSIPDDILDFMKESALLNLSLLNNTYTFTKEQIETAKQVEKVIIEEKEPTLSNVFASGKIIMWFELFMQNKIK